jgi:hypothetical protein
MPAIRCRHCSRAFQIGHWDLVDWRKLPEFRCPHCDRYTGVSAVASIVALLLTISLTAASLLGLRAMMGADGTFDGVETILFFAIGFAVAALASMVSFTLVHLLFGTFVDDAGG